MVYDEIAALTNKVLQERHLTQEGLADAFNECLVDTSVSRVSVSNWVRKVNVPDTDFLEAVLAAYPTDDWRHRFALSCLSVKSPLVWGKDGVVWRIGWSR